VQLILTITDDTVTLSIVDNGQGFDTTRQGPMGVGLFSMRERMKALGGDVEVESAPGKGTRIMAQCQRLGVGTSDTTVRDEKAALPVSEG
jgi:signal transduction histidine kinase